MRLQLLSFLACMAVLTAGCESAFKTNFVPDQLDVTYPPLGIEVVTVHQVGAQHPEEVQQRLYPEAVIVGTSAFDSTSTRPGHLREFAAEVGADVVIWSAIRTDSLAFTEFEQRPHTSRSTMHVREGKKVTTTHIVTESTEVVPRKTVRDYYRHFALFLRR